MNKQGYDNTVAPLQLSNSPFLFSLASVRNRLNF